MSYFDISIKPLQIPSCVIIAKPNRSIQCVYVYSPHSFIHSSKHIYARTHTHTPHPIDDDSPNSRRRVFIHPSIPFPLLLFPYTRWCNCLKEGTCVVSSIYDSRDVFVGLLVFQLLLCDVSATYWNGWLTAVFVLFLSFAMLLLLLMRNLFCMECEQNDWIVNGVGHEMDLN